MAALAEPTLPADRAAHDLPPKSYAQAADPDPARKPDGHVHAQTNGVEPQQNGQRTPDPAAGSGLDENLSSLMEQEHTRTTSLKKSGSLKKGNKANGVKIERGGVHETGLILERYKDHDGEPLTSIKPIEDEEDGRRMDESPSKKRRRSRLVSGRRAGAGWERSSIRWAPLNVPLKRRLQTLMVLLHTLSMVFLVSTFFFFCSIPLLWPILLPYLIHILFSSAGSDGKLTRRSEKLRRLPIWSLFASYFPARLHRSQELVPTRKYIFGYHPHGIISHGAIAAFATEALGFGQLFPGITNTLLTLDSNFRLPLYRDYALRLGLGSVSRESCENLLSQGGPNGEGMGRAITIVIGGAQESLEAQPGSMRLVLGRRKGFVKLAVRTGADLVPVLGFGENDLYDQLDPKEHPRIHRFQMAVKRLLGFTVPMVHARGVFNYDVGIMPYRRPLNIVVGKPIMVEMNERPDPAYVDEIHARYVAELQRLWDDWKDVFAPDREEEFTLVE